MFVEMEKIKTETERCKCLGDLKVVKVGEVFFFF